MSGNLMEDGLPSPPCGSNTHAHAFSHGHKLPRCEYWSIRMSKVTPVVDGLVLRQAHNDGVGAGELA
jgi:hypothetical protein